MLYWKWNLKGERQLKMINNQMRADKLSQTGYWFNNISHTFVQCDLIGKTPDLRVVQTQIILFLKSNSEKVGSDIQRLWNGTMNF